MSKKQLNPVESHFRSLWNVRPVHHDLKSVQSGVSALMELAKLNRDRLSKRLFLTQSQVVNLESRGKPVNFQVLVRLAQLCRDYRQFHLEDLFKYRIMDLRARNMRKR